MKIILLLACLSFINNLHSQNSFVLKGTTTDQFNSQQIVLVIRDQYSDSAFEIKDTTTIRNNRFVFNGSLPRQTEWAKIYTKTGFYYFIMDTGANNITIKEVDRNSKIYKNKLSNSIKNYSPANDLLREFEDFANSFYLKYARPSTKNPSVLVFDSVRIKQFHQAQIKMIIDNPTNSYALIHLYILFRELQRNPIELEDVYNRLDGNLKFSKLGLELYTNIQKAKAVLSGHSSPEFKIKSIEDSTISTTLLKGKNYLLMFGATWCKPCKENYPMLTKLFKKFKASNIEFIAINLDANKQLWIKQIEEYDLNWINASELVDYLESRIRKDFSIEAIPFYLLVNNEGKVVYNSFEMNDTKGILLEKYLNNID